MPTPAARERAGLVRFRGVTTATLVGVVLSAFVLGSCTRDGGNPTPQPAEQGAGTGGGTLRLGVVGVGVVDPATVGPTDQSALIVSDLLYDGLTSTDPTTAAVRPALASSWEHDDALTRWTFHLRDDARFSDGSTITAADVKASFERIAALGSASLAGARLEIVQGYREVAIDRSTSSLGGVKAVDDRSVEIDLTEGFAQLPDLVSAPEFGVVPKTTPAAQLGQPTGGGGVGLVSGATSGAFSVIDDSTGTVHLKRSEGSSVHIDGVDLVRFADAGAAYQAFVDGQVEWAPVPADKRTDARGRGAEYLESPLGAEMWFGINLAVPAFQDLRLRQAMVKAIDRQRIVRDVLPGRLALNGTVVAGVPGALEDACGDTCRHDPDAAKALVAEAFPDGAVPSVEVDYYDDPTQKAVADAVRSDLEAVGIPTSSKSLPFSEYRQFAVGGQEQVFSFGWVGIVPIADSYVGPLFLSGSGDNVTGFRSPDVDTATRKARTTLDPAERTQRYQDVERQVMAQVPLLPIAQFTASQVVATDRVNGWVTRLDGTFDVTAVTLSNG